MPRPTANVSVMNTLIRKCTLVIATAGCLMLTGCLGGSAPLPVYPGARARGGQQESGKIDYPKATVYVAAYESHDPAEKIADFYQKELGAKKGWRSTYNKAAFTGKFAQPIAQWSDGNIVATDTTMSNYKPVNPGKVGHQVLVVGNGDGATWIQLVWSEPKESPKKK